MAEVKGYTIGTWRGVPNYICDLCPFSTIVAAQIHRHMGLCHTGELKELEASQTMSPVKPVRVLLGMVTWNDGNVAAENLTALLEEQDRIEPYGISATVAYVLNGCNPASLAAINAVPTGDRFVIRMSNEHNLGSGHARNDLIKAARNTNADYLLMIDGDITVVPYSVYAMVRWFQDKAPLDTGCIGAFSSSCTKDPAKVSAEHTYINPRMVKTDVPIAWTQYGLFSMKVFNAGVQFDVGGPFGGPGWGFEDDDLWMQMVVKGFQSPSFRGMTYLHRNRCGSLVRLNDGGMDTRQMFDKRREYLLWKWRGLPQISAGLNRIRAIQLPMGVLG